MRLQELKNNEVKHVDKATVRTVRVFLQNSFYELSGTWHWELETDAVFCSKVMLQAPAGFIGTRAIFHPDDLPEVEEKLRTQEPVDHLQFRIITTYGEVKWLAGEGIIIHLQEQTADDLQKLAAEALVAEQERKAAAKHAGLLRELAEKHHASIGLGTWYFNASTGQTWYASAVFQLHGLPPQSLNAHLHTFHPFIHPDDAVLVTDFLDRAFRERTPLHIEYRILAGQTEKWIAYQADWFFSPQCEAILGGIFQEITERKTTERELDESKHLLQFQRQQLLYDETQLNVGRWQMNLLTRKASFSNQYYRIIGLKPQSLPPTLTSFLNYIHPDDREEVEAAYKKMLYEHAAPELEYRVVRADGKTRYIQQKGKLFLYEGEMIISGVLQDITVQRMLEKKLAREQEENWVQRQVAEQAADMASLVGWSVDLEEGDITWTEGFYKLLGFHKTTPPANITEKTLFSLIHPQDAKAFREHWANAMREKAPAVFGFRMMQRGTIYHMRAVFSLQVRADKTYFIGTVQDITAEQLLQQKLTQRVQLAESLTENIPDRVIITDTSNNILVWNSAAEKAYGIKKSDAIGENFFDVFPALKTEEEMQLFHRVHRGETVGLENAVSVTGNGYYSLQLLPLYSDGEVTGILHVVRNVTAETELRKNLNNRLHLIESLVQSSVDRIIALDANMNYLYWNKEAEAYYGYTKEEVLGKNILEVFPQMVNDPSYSQLRKALKGESVHIPAKPAIKKYFETYLVPIKDEKGSVVSLLWMAHDLSDEYRLLEEQQQAKEALEKEHSRLKEAQAIGRVGSFEWDTLTDKIRWSDEMYRIHGLKPQSEEMTLEKVLSYVHPDDKGTLQQLIDMRKKPMRVDFINRIIRPGGEVRMVRRQAESFSSEKGAVTHLVGTVQDITEQVKTEQQLKEQSHFLQRITETVPDMVSVIELGTGNTVFLNNEVFGANGFDAGRMLAMSAVEKMEIIHPDDRPALATYFRSFAAASDNDTVTAEYRAKIDAGEWRWFFVRGRVFQRNEEGAATHVLNVIQNITQKKEVEQELKHNKELLQSVFDASMNGIILFNAVRDGEGNIADFEVALNNAVTQRWNGVDLAGTRYAEKFPQIRQLGIFDAYVAVLKTGEPMKMEVLYEGEGFKNWFTISGVKLDDDALVATAEDVTERKKAEEEIKNQLAILHDAEELAKMGSWEYDIVTGNFIWSEGMYELFGLPKGFNVRPEIYLDSVLEEDRAIAKQLVKSLKKTHQPFEDTLRINKKGQVRQLKIKASAVTNDQGKAVKVIGVDLDITDIKQAEEELQETRRWLEQTAQASPDAICVYDLQKKQPVYLNNCLSEWTGVSNEELVALGMEGRLQLVHADDRLSLLHFNEKITMAKDSDVLTLEYRIKSKHDDTHWIRNRSKVFQRNASGTVTHIVSFLQEISEEKAAERLLRSLNTSLERQNRELEAKNDEITSFAFVASHDLKEPIRKIHTFSDWLLQKEENISQAGQQNLSRLHNAVKRLDTLVEDIVALTKVHIDKEDLLEVSLNVALQTAQQEMGEVIERTGAEIVGEKLPTVKGVENHLVYLFKNLLSNSIKFQKQGNKPVIRIEATQMKGLVKLTITDNGIGFIPEYSKRIFQMFRRLHGKHEYEGTGMGLAICKRIMEKHGGSITASGEPDNGATFTCWFPV